MKNEITTRDEERKGGQMGKAVEQYKGWTQNKREEEILLNGMCAGKMEVVGARSSVLNAKRRVARIIEACDVDCRDHMRTIFNTAYKNAMSSAKG